jgi:hypothetical protein
MLNPNRMSFLNRNQHKERKGPFRPFAPFVFFAI